MKNILLIFSLLLLFVSGEAQELKCKVQINTPKLQTVDPKVFGTLETAIQELMNNKKWTEDSYENFERIECNITINISEELSPTSFSGNLFIQASRPVYGSGYKTVILEHNDRDFVFEYKEYQPLIFVENQFSSNITSVLGFYAYMILGLDYDTFSPLGGSDLFQKAQEVLNTVPQSVGVKGWSSLDGQRNRYWMIESTLNPRVAPLREAMYDYHRQGLDWMSKDPEKGKESMISAMEKLKKVNSNYPNSMAMQMLVNAKSNEIIDIFLNSTSIQKRTVYAVMIKIDPANASKYSSIRR